jgi:hypothetical protein
MRLTLAAASLTLASALGVGALSAQGQNPPAPVPAQPGQPTQPRQPTPPPGQPTRPPEQGTTPSRPESPMSSQMGASREVTLTGCLARDTTKPATGGQATEAFILTNARTATGAAVDARGASSSSQSTRAPGETGDMGLRYRLMAKQDVNFTPHLNHQVRVTGTIMDVGAAGRSDAPAAGSATTGSAPTLAPMFHVTQLTMVSATCDTK